MGVDGIDVTDRFSPEELREMFAAFEAEDWAAVDAILEASGDLVDTADALAVEVSRPTGEVLAEAEKSELGALEVKKGTAATLARYWVSGEGGKKIAWNTPGDFTRCVRMVSEHMSKERAKGYCAIRHKQATGKWPGQKKALDVDDFEAVMAAAEDTELKAAPKPTEEEQAEAEQRPVKNEEFEKLHPRDEIGRFAPIGSSRQKASKSEKREQVKVVQRALIAAGFSVGKAGVDGIIGKDTTAAIRAFQKKAGIRVDGLVGPQTIKALREAVGGKKPKAAAKEPAKASKDKDDGKASGSSEPAKKPEAKKPEAKPEAEKKPAEKGPTAATANKATDKQVNGEYQKTYGELRERAKREGRGLHEDEPPTKSPGGAKVTDFSVTKKGAAGKPAAATLTTFADGWTYDVDGWHAPAKKDASDETDETKDEAMTLEHKADGLVDWRITDEDQGVVEALVSVTGVVDRVRDIIEPGAYTKTLQARKPKGVYHHQWTEPVSKTLEAKELLPGDPDLPPTQRNGDPWPTEAGALKVKMQFNLETQRGREAFSDAKFFGPDQEWSIGYNVPPGASTTDQKTGIRHIKRLDLFEYSPVLFGAMPMATTASLKDAQQQWQEVKDSAEPVEVKDEPGSSLGEEDVEPTGEVVDEPEGKAATVTAHGSGTRPGVTDNEDGKKAAAPCIKCKSRKPAVDGKCPQCGAKRSTLQVRGKDDETALEHKAHGMAGSYERLISALGDAVRASMSSPPKPRVGDEGVIASPGGTFAHVRATYPGFCVVEQVGPEDDTPQIFRVKYTVDEEGNVELGDKDEAQIIERLVVKADEVEVLELKTFHYGQEVEVKDYGHTGARARANDAAKGKAKAPAGKITRATLKEALPGEWDNDRYGVSKTGKTSDGKTVRAVMGPKSARAGGGIEGHVSVGGEVTNIDAPDVDGAVSKLRAALGKDAGAFLSGKKDDLPSASTVEDDDPIEVYDPADADADVDADRDVDLIAEAEAAEGKAYAPGVVEALGVDDFERDMADIAAMRLVAAD